MTSNEPTSSEPILIIPYDDAWPRHFTAVAATLRRALGGTALRIDHIGSTAVPGLAAKPIVDVQISVAGFEPFDTIRRPLEEAGYRWRADNPDLTKRYFRESAGVPRTHIHVRRRGSWSEQAALLFRDYLRATPEAATHYAAVKRQLAREHRDDRRAYTENKGPIIWVILMEANEWSQRIGWQPGPSDG